MLDIAGFRAERKEELCGHHARGHVRVRSTSASQPSDAMNPFSKVCRDVVAEEGLTSESEASSLIAASSSRPWNPTQSENPPDGKGSPGGLTFVPEGNPMQAVREFLSAPPSDVAVRACLRSEAKPWPASARATWNGLVALTSSIPPRPSLHAPQGGARSDWPGSGLPGIAIAACRPDPADSISVEPMVRRVEGLKRSPRPGPTHTCIMRQELRGKATWPGSRRGEHERLVRMTSQAHRAGEFSLVALKGRRARLRWTRPRLSYAVTTCVQGYTRFPDHGGRVDTPWSAPASRADGRHIMMWRPSLYCGWAFLRYVFVVPLCRFGACVIGLATRGESILEQFFRCVRCNVDSCVFASRALMLLCRRWPRLEAVARKVVATASCPFTSLRPNATR